MPSFLAPSAHSKSSRSIIAMFLVLFATINITRTLLGQCPPAGLQNSFTDIQVADPFAVGGATVGISSYDDAGIIIAYEHSDPDAYGSEIFAARYSSDGTPLGDPFPLTQHNGDEGLDQPHHEFHQDASLAVSSDGTVTVGFTSQMESEYKDGSCVHDGDCPHYNCDLSCAYYGTSCNGGRCSYNVDETIMLNSRFNFSSTPIPIVEPILLGNHRVDYGPSAGGDSLGHSMFAWRNDGFSAEGSCANDAPFGWLLGPSWGSGSAFFGCDQGCASSGSGLCAYDHADLQPCIAMRNESFLVAWSDPEDPNVDASYFNIKLQAYTSGGATVGSQRWVNDTGTGLIEVYRSDQVSPAVAMDEPDENGRSNVVVVWAGQNVPGVDGWGIFARRFVFDPMLSEPIRDPNASAHEGNRNDFIVANTYPGGPLSAALAHPTVALTTDPNHRGRFIVAWNANVAEGLVVHGQFFEGDGRPMGCEFRVHAGTAPLPGQNFACRTVAASARHTLAYGANGDVVIAYTLSPSLTDLIGEVWLTIIPAGTAEAIGGQLSCCKGDVNRDGLVDARDIQPFINLLRTVDLQTHPAVELCPADVNEDSKVDLNDVVPFVSALLSGATCGGGGLLLGLHDCNANGVFDAEDIAQGTSPDCNENLIPDECDIASETSADVNGNGIPDECEADCNGNHVPDSWDISQSTSSDVNSNGVPDECERDCNRNGVPDDWDISQATSADCNNNGEPDECEADCNSNGVPDDCDIDPSDPDGNSQVSLDCNGNQVPDECDLSRGPPFGSLDCNDNGIPDECDIAACESDPACGDCNGNHIPDSCDIASSHSADENENGVPDECEQMGGNQMQQMEGEGTGETPLPPMSPEAAWDEFYEWADAQCWGPDCETTGAEQFQSYVDKLEELGIPVGGG